MADTFMVWRTGDSGVGSLRWAIDRANQHSGPDQIRFTLPRRSSHVILPKSPLPKIRDDYTAIIGDTDDDRVPNVAINGAFAGAASGLHIRAEGCAIGGLAITNFEHNGIRLDGANGCLIYSCHVGVNLAGTKGAHNGQASIAIRGGSGNRIGGFGRRARNVISAGPGGSPAGGPGVLIMSSTHNVVAGNNIGIDRAGTAILACVSGGTGVLLERTVIPATTVPGPPCSHNTIGGTKPGERNIIAGVNCGICLQSATDNTISGNWLGLASDGNTGLGNRYMSVDLGAGSSNNVVGGTAVGARNVFAGGPGVWSYVGVDIEGAGTEGNKVQGNYFGTNAAGTQWRATGHCVYVSDNAGAQLIGGRGTRAGNHFCPYVATAVTLYAAGSGTTINGNTFGVLPDGTDTGGYACGIAVARASCKVLNNHIAGASGSGLLVLLSGAKARAFGNVFRKCRAGVFLKDDGRCVLGNLGNASTADDGRNIFRPTNTRHIKNNTPYAVKAEGNSFGTTVKSKIDAKIVDKLDNPVFGRVDFIPLKNGVIPTGDAVAVPLSVTNAAVLPTKARGAEIAFTLSAPADVTATVLNIAGRPVATVVRDVRADAGVSRLVWSGRTLNGTPAPPGTYLVRIAARNSDGVQASALCRLRLER